MEGREGGGRRGGCKLEQACEGDLGVQEGMQRHQQEHEAQEGGGGQHVQGS